MKSFHICPCCDKWYWFKRGTCNKCGYVLLNNGYIFRTGKYTIDVIDEASTISFTDKSYIWWNLLSGHRAAVDLQTLIQRKLSPKSTDEDIDKLLMLM